jgi:hypothetical protein
MSNEPAARKAAGRSPPRACLAEEKGLQVTKLHYAKAKELERVDAVQKPVQQPAETTRDDSQDSLGTDETPLFCRGVRLIATTRRIVEWRIGDLNP